MDIIDVVCAMTQMTDPDGRNWPHCDPGQPRRPNDWTQFNPMTAQWTAQTQ